MSPIHSDGANSDFESGLDEAADAFAQLNNSDADTPSEDDEAKNDTQETEVEDDNEDKTDEGAEDGGETSEETPEGNDEDESVDEGAEDEDEKVIIKHKVDGEEREFTLAHLKRLAGQEASLTRKSQEVADRRKVVDQQAAAHVALLSQALKRAEERYDPFSKIDFLAAAKNPEVSAEELTAARNAAQAAYDDVQFFKQDLDRITEALRVQQQQELLSQAKEAIKVLSDPDKGIKGWSEPLYAEIRTFATAQGLSQDIVDNLVDPAAIKLINMARLYMKGHKTVETAKSDKKKNVPKRIVKSVATAATTKKVISKKTSADAMKRLERSGSVDDAANAFAALRAPSDDE